LRHQQGGSSDELGGALAYLQHLTTNDIRKAAIGKALYAHLLNDAGGVIDDIFIYRLEEEKYLVIVNASRKEVDLAWMESNKKNYAITILEAPYAAAIAVQGPKAVNLMTDLSDDIPSLGRNQMAEFPIGDYSALVARTGYTGEDGVELFAPAGHLLPISELIIKAGLKWDLKPCGLGARDTLRTEAAYPLYGHELDEHHTSLQAGLAWVVSFDKGDFIGRDALVKQKEQGFREKLYGFKVESGGVARPGGQIFIKGQAAGAVTSGTFSPTLGIPIGIAYLPTKTAESGEKLVIQQGTREFQAVTVKPPFYKREKR